MSEWSSPGQLMLAATLLPLLGSVGIGLTGRWPNLREAITLLTATATFACVCGLLGPLQAGETISVELMSVVPHVAIAFRLEPLGMLYALVASGLWIPTSIYAVGYMRGHGEGHQTRFFVCFALAIFAALGIAFSGNLLTLFLFYEVLTLSTYPLVAHNQDEEAKRAGRVYLGILMFTSVCLLLFAILWTYAATGQFDFELGGFLAGHVTPQAAGILLVLYCFGAGKAALMPLHRWLPNAMVAPTPVSALLHAVAVVKAGVFTILKVVIYVFGLDLVRSLEATTYMLYVAAGTVILSSLIALRQDNLKARLAYSTISQLAYIVLGALIATPDAALGGGLHIAMHAVGKITLFFCAGAIFVGAHKKKVSELDGLGKQMPFTMLAFLFGAISIIGLPPMGGSWSKWYLALGAAEAEHHWVIAVFMLSSLLNIAYLMPIPVRAFFMPLRAAGHGHGDVHGHANGPDHEHEHGHAHGHGHGGEAPILCVVPLSVTAVGCLALFFYGEPIVALLRPLFEVTR